MSTDPRPDIYMALVAPTGTDLSKVRDSIVGSFATYSYEVVQIKVSKLISDFSNLDTADLPEDKRIRTLMNAGDDLRRLFRSGDAAMRLVVNQIRQYRAKNEETSDGLVGAKVFLIESIKNTNELKQLDKIYGRNLYTISVFSETKNRIDRIARKLSEQTQIALNGDHKSRAEKIIREDQDRGDPNISQDVINTFPLADFFANADGAVEDQIRRFVDLIFGRPYISPTIDEFGMYVAKAAAYRSGDLSRQVGASILDDRGSVITTGCNEVPVPGGGFFFEGMERVTDNRDHMRNVDPNYEEIQNTVQEFIAALKGAEMLSTNVAEDDSDILAGRLLHGDLKNVLKGTRVRSIIEFGRIVHAEMHAITDAAKRGVAIESKILYCTTFPCHICARHIISSGIARVVYIEPYPKSQTLNLYESEIGIDIECQDSNKVHFVPFMGVAPALYQRVFSHRSKKTNVGTVADFLKDKALPQGAVHGVSRLSLERFFSALTPDGGSAIPTGRSGEGSETHGAPTDSDSSSGRS